MSQSPSLFPGCLGASPGFPVSGGLLGLSSCCGVVAEQATSQPSIQPASCHASTRFVLLFVLECSFARSLCISFFPSATESVEPLPVAGIVLWSSAAPGMKKVWKLHILPFHRCFVCETLRSVGWVQWWAQCCRQPHHLVIACCCFASEGQRGFCAVV